MAGRKGHIRPQSGFSSPSWEDTRPPKKKGPRFPNAWYAYPVQIQHQTKKAYLIQRTDTSEDPSWVPKSKTNFMSREDTNTGVITIPGWLAHKKGWKIP